MKILVVDDNDQIRLTTAAFLREEGYLVVEACDGTQAIHCYDLHGADAVVMDIQMPVMNGADAARVLRGRKASLPIFAFTAKPHLLDESRMIFSEILVKPMLLSKLCEILSGYQNDRRRSDSE